MFECPSCGDLCDDVTWCRQCGCCGDCCPRLSAWLDDRIENGATYIVKKRILAARTDGEALAT